VGVTSTASLPSYVTSAQSTITTLLYGAAVIGVLSGILILISALKIRRGADQRKWGIIIIIAAIAGAPSSQIGGLIAGIAGVLWIQKQKEVKEGNPPKVVESQK